MNLPNAIRTHRFAIAGIAVAVLAVVGIAVLMVQARQAMGQPISFPFLGKPTPVVAPVLHIVPELSTAQGTTMLTVSLRSEKAISLSAFSLELLLTPSKGTTLVAGKLALSPSLITNGWTFPISKIQKQSSGAIAVKLSGAFIKKTPDILSGDTALVTLPLGHAPSVSVSIALDQTVTEFFGANGQKISVMLDQQTTAP